MRYLKSFRLFESKSIVEEIRIVFEDSMFEIELEERNNQTVLYLEISASEYLSKIGLSSALPLPNYKAAGNSLLNKAVLESKSYKTFINQLRSELRKRMLKFIEYESSGIVYTRYYNLDDVSNIESALMNKNLRVCGIRVNYIKESSLAHGLSGGSGAPAYGLGGVNYGYENIPSTLTKGDTSFIYSELTGKYYDNDEIKEIFNKYLQLCREEQCNPIVNQIEDLTSESFDEILNSLQ